LGRTHAEADANRDAITAFEQAVKLDAATFAAPARDRIRQLRLRARGCQF
jgi:hypothetical protein